MSGINGANKTTGSIVQKALEQQNALMSKLTGQNSAAAQQQTPAAQRTPNKQELADSQAEARGDKLVDAGLNRNTRDNPVVASPAGSTTPAV